MGKTKANTVRNQRSLLITICLTALYQLALFSIVVKAESNQVFEPRWNSYEVQQKNVFDITEDYMVDTFVFGEASLGALSLTGDVERETTFSNVPAYVTDTIQLMIMMGMERLMIKNFKML